MLDVLQVFALPWTPATPKLIHQLMEEQPIGTKLTQLQATDNDSNIEAYHLSTNDYLQINNLTGNFDVERKLCGFRSDMRNSEHSSFDRLRNASVSGLKLWNANYEMLSLNLV